MAQIYQIHCGIATCPDLFPRGECTFYTCSQPGGLKVAAWAVLLHASRVVLLNNQHCPHSQERLRWSFSVRHAASSRGRWLAVSCATLLLFQALSRKHRLSVALTCVKCLSSSVQTVRSVPVQQMTEVNNKPLTEVNGHPQ